MARKPFTQRYTEEEMLGALIKHGDNLIDYYHEIKDDWAYWIEYKWLTHKHQYALPRTEAFAIANLYELSNKNPAISRKLIDWNAQQNWEGMFRPKDLFLWSSWQREVEVPEVYVLGYHTDLASEGWPQAALSMPDWCMTMSAESEPVNGYNFYLSETVAFFGPLKPGNYLKEQEWGCWRQQSAPFDFGINPRDFASLAIKRIELHIKFHQANEFSIRSFMLRHHKPEMV